MKLVRLFVIALLAISASAQTTELTGKWIITWLDNNDTQPIELVQSGNNISGTYINNSKDSCPVSGSLSGSALSFTVQCPKWDIKMSGTVTPKGKTVENGTYTAYGRHTSPFRMAKEQ
jgi:hypothetical protein